MMSEQSATPNPATVSQPHANFRRLTIWPAAILIALAIGFTVVTPYFFSHYATVNGQREPQLLLTHDLTNHYFVMNQFEKVFRSGVIYPRWLPDANNGYGIATMNYYPPGFYYLTTIINAVTGNWHTTLFILMALAMAGSGLALFALARTFFSPLSSAFAALVYMLLPYHHLDLYWRGALPEFIGFILIPLVFYFAYKVGSGGAWRHYAGLGLCYGLHLMTHLPVGLLLFYTLIFYALLWARQQSDWRIVARIGGGLAFGLLVSAVYLLPAMLEARYALDSATGQFPYHNSYIDLSPTFDRFGQLMQSAFKLNVLLLLAAIAIWRAFRRTPIASPDRPSATGASPVDTQVKLWMILCGVTLFMTTALSYDFSRLLPKIQIAVPPFRWLAIASVFGALLVAFAIDRVRKQGATSTRMFWVYRAMIGAVIALNLWVCVRGVIGEGVSNLTFQPPNNYIEAGLTPKDATLPANLPDTAKVTTDPEGSVIDILHWDPQQREVRVIASQPSVVRLKTYNFPGWAARIDGQVAPLVSDADGVQTVSIPPGSHVIETRFENTLPRSAGAMLTLIGLLAVVGLGLADKLQLKSRTARSTSAVQPSQAASATATSASAQAGSRALPLKPIVITALAIIVAAVGIYLVASRATGKSPANANAAEPGAGRGQSGVGSEGRLFVEGLDTIPIAADEPALDQLVGAIASKNGATVDALADSGKVTKVLRNTRVLVLQLGTGKIKVRVLEGDHALKEGWVVERWVR